MAPDLPDEAEHRGPTSEAAHLAGPTADPAAWEQRRAYGYSGGDVLGEEHPLWVLGSWDLAVADHLGHLRRSGRITVESAGHYLDGNLADLAEDPDFDFPKLAGQLRRCRAHLEAVLHDGEQVEQGAPCLACRRPVTRTTGDDGRTTFECRRCRRTLTDNEYRLAVRAAYLAHADRLPAVYLAERIGVPASTIRRWANVRREQPDGQDPVELPPILRSCGRDTKGRKLYRVADAEHVRDNGGEALREEIPA